MVSILAVALGCLFSCLVGCDNNPTDRMLVSGTVNFEGQPVSDGTILFSPTVSGQYQSNGVIENGLYRIESSYGPSLGEYKVQIDGFRSGGKLVSAGPLHGNEQVDEDAESYIPAEFNSQSTLRVTITTDNSKQLDFDL